MKHILSINDVTKTSKQKGSETIESIVCVKCFAQMKK